MRAVCFAPTFASTLTPLRSAMHRPRMPHRFRSYCSARRGSIRVPHSGRPRRYVGGGRSCPRRLARASCLYRRLKLPVPVNCFIVSLSTPPLLSGCSMLRCCITKGGRTHGGIALRRFVSRLRHQRLIPLVPSRIVFAPLPLPVRLWCSRVCGLLEPGSTFEVRSNVGGLDVRRGVAPCRLAEWLIRRIVWLMPRCCEGRMHNRVYTPLRCQGHRRHSL